MREDHGKHFARQSAYWPQCVEALVGKSSAVFQHLKLDLHHALLLQASFRRSAARAPCALRHAASSGLEVHRHGPDFGREGADVEAENEITNHDWTLSLYAEQLTVLCFRAVLHHYFTCHQHRRRILPKTSVQRRGNFGSQKVYVKVMARVGSTW